MEENVDPVVEGPENIPRKKNAISMSMLISVIGVICIVLLAIVAYTHNGPLYLNEDNLHDWELGVRKDLGDEGRIFEALLSDDTEKSSDLVYYDLIKGYSDTNANSRLDQGDKIHVTKPIHSGTYYYMLRYVENGGSNYELARIKLEVKIPTGITPLGISAGTGNATHWVLSITSNDAQKNFTTSELQKDGVTVPGYTELTRQTSGDPQEVMAWYDGAMTWKLSPGGSISIKKPSEPGTYTFVTKYYGAKIIEHTFENP